jgi:hypothetical protein
MRPDVGILGVVKSLKSLESTPGGRFLRFFIAGVASYLGFFLVKWPVDWIFGLFGAEAHADHWWDPWALGPAVLIVGYGFLQLLSGRD